MPYNFSQSTWPNYNLNIANSECGYSFLGQFLFFRRALGAKIFAGSSWRSNLPCRRIEPALSSALLLFSAFSSEALTARTTSVINGSAPYLTFDGGRTRATNVDELLSITLPSGIRVTPSSNTSSAANPIQLQDANINFTHIGMFVPTNTSSVTLSTLIGPLYNYWRDDDGDGQGSGGISATGSLTLSIVDKAGNAVDRQDTLTICNAPYKVTLSSSEGTLSTHYGVPSSLSFSASSATYYITPKATPVVCFVRPNLSFGNSGSGYDGPSNIWNSAKGFLTQSTVPSGYHRNFPTTGANNLYFDLDIDGVNANQLTWSPVTHSDITATMKPNSSTSVRVTLTGPAATSSQWNSSSPGNIPNPALPATFELVGRDSSGNAVIKYGFRLKQWFVNRGTGVYTNPDSQSWCNSIGYQMPRIRDLTNGVSSDISPPPVGASPFSPGNHYMRHIDAGFFSEWGYMYGYTGPSFANSFYWTSDTSGSYQFSVNSFNGNIHWCNPRFVHYVVCASVLRP